jgi:drug/metabolite transporter (DMT)-like permease
MPLPDQNLKAGIFFALCSAIFLSIMNIFAKILVEDIDPIMVTFWRNAIALSILITGFVITRQFHFFKTTQLKSQIFRAVIGTAGMTMAVWTFQLMPVTEGVVISFASPLFVVLLSYPILRERVGIYRIGATLFGLFGIVIIVGFDADNLTPKGVIVAMTWAFLNGLVLIMLRQLGKKDHALTTTFYFLFVGLLLTGSYIPFADNVVPSTQSLLWTAVGIGIVGVISLFVKTESFRHAPASVLAPLAYTILLWSVFFDYVIWNHVASKGIWIGAGIIIFSNLFILWREHKKSRKDEILQA